MKKTQILSHAAAAAVLALTGSMAHAVDGTWAVDANGNWSLGTNWASGTVADGNDGTANFVFNTTAARTVTNDTPRTIGNILFQDTTTPFVGWTLAGTAANPLTLSTTSGTSTITSASPIGYGIGATISAVLAGSNNIVFTLAPSATTTQPEIAVTNALNSYTGTTGISNGFLSVGANSILATGSPLGISSSAIIVGNANTSSSVNVNTGAPSVGLDVIATGAATANYTIARDIDSSTTANVAGRTDLRYNNNTLGGNGTLTVSGNWALSGVSSNGHTYGLVAQQPGQTVNVTGNITGANAGNFRLGDYGNGVGTIRLAGTNTYAGITTLEEGALVIGANAPLTSGALGNNAAFQLASNGVTSLNSATANATLSATTDGGYTVNKAVTLSTSTFTPTGGTLTQVALSWTLGSSAAASSTFAGNVNSPNVAASRTLNLTQAAGGSTTFSGIINANTDANNVTVIEKTGAGTVLLTNANTYDGGTRVTGGTLLVNNVTGSGTGTGAVTVGVVSNAQSGLTSTTPGATAARVTRQLDGISTAVLSQLQVGQTVTGTGITAGSTIQSIAFNATTGTGSIGISSTVTIPIAGLTISDLGFGALSTTGTLGGTGTISGATTVNAGSSVAPGAGGIGTLGVGSASIIGSLVEEVGALTSDTLVDAGALSLDPASTLSLSTLATPTASFYTLATYTSLSGTFGTVTGLPAGYALDYGVTVPNAITLVATGLPEPTTLGAAATVAGIALRRRRSAK